MNRTGGSQKMETRRVSKCTNATTPLIDTPMVGKESSLLDPEKNLSCEVGEATPSLFGENSNASVSRSNTALTVPRSAMKEKSAAANSFDKRTRLLIASGLVRGVIPSSIRKESDRRIRATAFLWPDGDDAVSPKADC